MFAKLFAVKTVQAAEFISDLGSVDPLKGANVLSIINKAFTWLVSFAALLVPIIIVWGAFQILTSGGEAEKFQSGRKAIIYAVLGFIIILMARGLVDVVDKALK